MTNHLLLFAVIVALAIVVALVVIVWRSGAVDKDKASAALTSAEGKAANKVTDLVEWVRGKFARKPTP